VSRWPMLHLGDVATTLADGDWIESKDQSPEGIRLLQTGNVGLGVFKENANRKRYVSEETFQGLNCAEVFAGDVLISRLPDPIGRACLVPNLAERSITAVDCAIVRLDARILPEFFVHYSTSRTYLDAVASSATGSTRQRISRSALAKIPIPLPPLDEQKRIVAKLDAVNLEVAHLKDVKLKSSNAMQAWFEKETGRIYGAVNATTIPLRELVVQDSPITYGAVQPGPVGDVPFIRSGDLKNSRIDEANLRTISSEVDASYARTRIKGGEVLVALVGVPGASAVVPPSLAGANIARQVALIRLPSEISAEYVSGWLNSATGRESLKAITQGSVQQVINLRDLRELVIPVPALEDQLMICRQAEALSAEVGRRKQSEATIQNALQDLIASFSIDYLGGAA
jgi:type I restriction enzyme, S subunit